MSMMKIKRWENMDLSGTWSFELDPRDEGIAGQWRRRSLGQTVQLPGSLQAQGHGDDVTVDTQWTGTIIDRAFFDSPRYAPYRQPGNVKVPFWLQPEKVYTGPAWYRREVDVPAEWQGRRLSLFLERPHWETRVWVDDQEYPPQNGLSTPHVYDLGTRLSPGKHTLTLRVDNRMLINVGPNAHSMTDHTQTNWNGVVGRIELVPGSPVYVDEVQVYPDVERKSFHLRVRLVNALDQPAAGVMTLTARGYNSETPHVPPAASQEVQLPPGETLLEADYPLGAGAQTWDEFHPALYRMIVILESQPAVDELSAQTAAALASQPPAPGEEAPRTGFYDFKEVLCGLREMGVDGTQLTINGRKIFLRGTLECCIFPLTGYPPTDVDSWRKVIAVCQRYGLNHLRFHSWCPPEAAFIAADEAGFYFSIECASWANQGSSLGEDPVIDEWLYQEGHRITTFYGSHPSFIMMAYGNEPDGKIDEWLTEWVNYWKMRDNRRLYTSGAGWPMIPVNDYHNTPKPRIQAWGEGLASRINARPPETLTDYADFVQDAGRPVVSHEIGQWCVYPNFDEMKKYTGHIKPRNFEIFRDFLEQAGMLDQAHDFLIASGRQQVLAYKEDIESALRTPGFAGFQLLDLHDFPGQGTALVGVLDPFWEEKGYVTGEEYSRFCNATVPLLRMEKRYWRAGETFRARLDVAHFGAAPLAGVTPAWKLLPVDGSGSTGEPVRWGGLPAMDIPIGNGIILGEIEIPLADLLTAGSSAARQFRLLALLPGLENPNGQPVANTWDIWVFPDVVDTAVPTGVEITNSLDGAALDHLARGGAVLLTLPPERVRTESVIGFSPVFWNTAWTRGQPPHTLGLLIQNEHPAFAGFPTAFHSDWQWWDLVYGSEAMMLGGLPGELRPLVQPIDTWFEARKLGLLFEARVNGGQLLVTSMDLKNNLDNRPVARQLRASLLRYAASPDFNPRVEVTPEAIRGLTD